MSVRSKPQQTPEAPALPCICLRCRVSDCVTQVEHGCLASAGLVGRIAVSIPMKTHPHTHVYSLEAHRAP